MKRGPRRGGKPWRFLFSVQKIFQRILGERAGWQAAFWLVNGARVGRGGARGATRPSAPVSAPNQ